ncbi:Nitrogenase molybdenum-iron protein alpha chain [Novipirellula aureliae]|uniref:nitrogenase n=1 Tax=Novipirellula aureliae TaxID=2527966 RepID=A0A5C6E9E5_9BACT|nr:nitrogenase component I subunit alpha [Novipirellula aureliae]TWU45145.1 Nitrogenase molybdenum-iron protein alpha chain [Novipirellula aureliae]
MSSKPIHTPDLSTPSEPFAVEALTADQIKGELTRQYPAKVKRKRDKQIVLNEKTKNQDGSLTLPVINANTRTSPGIITQRGCTYAGCKGVIMGPTRDIINITHGPIGCGFYSWLTRRNQTKPPTEEHDNYIPYSFSTDMQDENIIFGGEKKLKAAIQEAYDMFHPKAIAVFATCPVGLIGDDVHQACREMKRELVDCNVFAFSCEGYKGVSQSAGHHIANNGVFQHMVGNQTKEPKGKFKINLLGEYNIGGDAFVLEEMFEKCGITLLSTFSGNSTVEQFERSHWAELNCVMCHRSINYVADMIEKKYGAPWIKVNFIGAKATAKSLRKIAEFFNDADLTERVENFITAEYPAVLKAQAEVLPRTEGKRAMLFVGGSRAHSYQELFKEIGMKTIAAGYEFAHRDDYEGRKVLPDIKVDADSRNIEELTVERDEKLYREPKTNADLESLQKRDFFENYQGMMADMGEKAMIIDDVSHHEAEKLIEMCQPDIFCAGIKEKYAVQKLGVPCKQLHSYDYGGPYAGFQGAVRFYQDIDRMVNSKVKDMIKAPWE